MPRFVPKKIKLLYLAARQSQSLRIALIYFIISLVWIFLSDSVVFLFKDQLSTDAFLAVNSAKGFAFVTATGVMLFLLIRKNNKAIIINQNEYRSLYESNPSPMWIYDPQTLRFVSVNKTAIAIYGYSEEDFLGMTIKDIRPIEDHVKLIKAINIAGKFKKGGIWRHTKKDGTIIYADVSSNRITFKGRSAVMILARDYSQMMLNQDMLQKANMDLADDKKRLIDIQELSKIAAWDYFIDDGRLILSEEVYKVFGLPRTTESETYGAFLKTIYREDLPTFIAATKLTTQQGHNLDVIHRFYLGKNDIRYVRQLGKLEMRDGKPYKIRGTMQDITEIKLMEYERNLVNNENKKLGNIITRINNMIVIEDAESRITWVNKAFEQFTGYRLAEIEGKRPSEFIMDPLDPELVQSLNRAQKRLESFSVDMLLFTKSREQYWVNIEFTPMFDDGKFTGYISVHNDITIRKEKEAQINKQNLILKEIAWLSSHEIRRPVASIMGLMDLLCNATSEIEKNEYLQLLNECARQLDEIIHQINQTIHDKLPEDN